MKRIIFLGMLTVLVVSSQASAILTNGDWNTGDETGWTRWRTPWGSTEQWSVTAAGPTPFEGSLSGQGGSGSFGWFQVVPVTAGQMVSLSGSWAGNIGSTGWAELMLFSTATLETDATYTARIDTGNVIDIAFKKDSWGMNSPTTWTWESASLSPHPSGNGGVVTSLGYVVVATKLGSYPSSLGNVSFDNIDLQVIPAPGAIILSSLGVGFIGWFRKRRTI